MKRTIRRRLGVQLGALGAGALLAGGWPRDLHLQVLRLVGGGRRGLLVVGVVAAAHAVAVLDVGHRSVGVVVGVRGLFGRSFAGRALLADTTRQIQASVAVVGTVGRVVQDRGGREAEKLGVESGEQGAQVQVWRRAKVAEKGSLAQPIYHIVSESRVRF